MRLDDGGVVAVAVEIVGIAFRLPPSALAAPRRGLLASWLSISLIASVDSCTTAISRDSQSSTAFTELVFGVGLFGLLFRTVALGHSATVTQNSTIVIIEVYFIARFALMSVAATSFIVAKLSDSAKPILREHGQEGR